MTSTETETETETETAPRRLDQIPKTYDPHTTEQRIYQWWESSGYFKPRRTPENAKRPPFVISMPPPNVTGALHLGHAVTATLEDIMIRYHRMRGDPTLWVPGEDHAGIATQAVVEKQIAKEGTDRHQMGREAFVERVWEWARHSNHPTPAQHRPLSPTSPWHHDPFTPP